MNIVYNDENLPNEKILKEMNQAGSLCLEREGIKSDNIEVSVTFVTTDEIQELNNKFMGKDKPTDVLSFPQYDDLNSIDPNDPLVCLGDVVISLENAIEQAFDYNHSVEREIIYLFVHSMFHLLGYDHMNEEDKKVMREAEESVMEAMSLPR